MTKTKKRPYPHYKFPEEINIKIKALTPEQCSWYGVPAGSYDFRCENYGWFPTDAVMGVVNNRYTDTHGIGATISGNMGSAGLAILDKDKAVQMLRNAGYNVSE